jgi:selenocysteine lyase/cysteine desulfurase
MTATEAALGRWRNEFPVFRTSVYLNSCSLGALSLRSRAAVVEVLDLWDQRGAAAWYDTWLPATDRLRQGYARVIGAEPDSISLHASISQGLSVVAESLDYRNRPKVVTTSLDFPTVAYQWLAKAGHGVEVEVVESPDGISVPLERLAQAIDDRTALVATSHVFFTSGAIQDIPAIAALAHAQGALLLVDGYHAAGQIAVNIEELQADFYLSGGLKWLLGGPGIAFLHVGPGLVGRLEPRITGWFAHAAPFRFDPHHLERAAGARRFDLGTPAIASVYAQLAALSLLNEVGLREVHQATRTLTEDLIAEATARGLRPRVALKSSDRSAIVMLPRPDAAADVRRLAANGYIVDSRPGHVRVSPYFYNVPDDHRRLLEHLARD